DSATNKTYFRFGNGAGNDSGTSYPAATTAQSAGLYRITINATTTQMYLDGALKYTVANTDLSLITGDTFNPYMYLSKYATGAGLSHTYEIREFSVRQEYTTGVLWI